MPQRTSQRAQYKPIEKGVFGRCRYAGKPTEEWYDGWCIKTHGCDKYDWLHTDDGVANQPDVSRNVHAEFIEVYPPEKQISCPPLEEALQRVVRTKQKAVRVPTHARCSV